MTQQYASAPFQQQITYPAGMTEYVQPNMPDLIEQQELMQDTGGYDAAYHRYQERLQATLQSVKDGRLVQAGQCLLAISEFLLGEVVDLGK